MAQPIAAHRAPCPPLSRSTDQTRGIQPLPPRRTRTRRPAWVVAPNVRPAVRWVNVMIREVVRSSSLLRRCAGNWVRVAVDPRRTPVIDSSPGGRAVHAPRRGRSSCWGVRMGSDSARRSIWFRTTPGGGVNRRLRHRRWKSRGGVPQDASPAWQAPVAPQRQARSTFVARSNALATVTGQPRDGSPVRRCGRISQPDTPVVTAAVTPRCAEAATWPPQCGLPAGGAGRRPRRRPRRPGPESRGRGPSPGR